MVTGRFPISHSRSSILVEKIIPPSKTSSGILLTERTTKLNSGKVVAVGPGTRGKDGKFIPVAVKEGDTVLLPDYGGTEIKLDDKAMGIRARSGNDRLRTIWTPEMDRFFIDLLLDEVSKGNKFDDHLFNKRAWKYMTSLLNAKFKYQCEKDVLKNRHKTLRNLYRAVKKILDQKGFSWDEARQMIVADDGAWDEYIKMHPDRRAYRIKTIPYYHDLCLIYGDAAFEEKGHNVAEPLLLPNEVEALAAIDSKDAVEGALGVLQEVTRVEGDPIAKELVVEEMRQETPNVMGNAVTNRSRTNWQPPMDRYFIDLMLEQLHKGNQIDGVFRKQAWMDMIASFNAKFGFDYDMDVLKDRYKTLKRQYKVIKNLLELDGFRWDDARQMVTADDYVWQDYIKTNTDARQFMTRPVPYYKDLCLICSHQSIDRSDGFSSQYLYLQNDFEISGMLQSSQSPAASVSGEDKDDNPHIGSNTIDHRNKRKLESFSNSSPSKRSRGKEEGAATPSHQMAIAVPALPDERKDESSNSVSMENVIGAIQSLPDMDITCL